MAFDLTSPLPEKGVAVPIYWTRTGYKGVAVWNFAILGFLSPSFRLFEDEVEMKVRRTQRRLLRDIEMVEAPKWRQEQNLLTLIWNDTPWTFTVNIVRPDWQKQVVEFLKSRDVPLAPSARRLLDVG